MSLVKKNRFVEIRVIRGHILLAAFALCCSLGVSAQTETTQQDSAWWKHWKVTGSVQSDVLVPQEDYKLGTGTYDSPVLTNTYAEAHLNSAHIGIGARFEFLQYPLPGYEPEFKGWGLGMLYLKGKWNTGEVTVGSFYDQFGSGFIFRTYENRSLGIDNSLMGLRVLYKPYKGITLKVLGGHQRRYWEYNKGLVAGADLELNIDQWVQKMQEKGTYWTIGLSAVNKYEKANNDELPAISVPVDNGRGDQFEVYHLNVPTNVQAYDFRTQVQTGDFNILAEYAIKSHDPSFDNDYTYRHGNAALLSASWSKKGISGLLQVKRSEDMSFRSKRSVTGTSSQINHLPAFAMQHTYALATLYPYATQMADGEWAFQTEWAYSIKKHTFLGGKYGTNLQLHFSHIRSLDKTPLEGVTDVTGTSGYTNGFGIGDELYYQDVNLQIAHKFSKVFKLNFMYMNQIYNKTVIEGEGGKIYSNIFIADGRFTLSKKFILRAEAQYLHTNQDQGDWYQALLELSFQPHWMLTLSNMYNGHVPGYAPDGSLDGTENKVHYWQALLTWTHGAHRLQGGYAKTRAGYNCAGGVCRYVPASKGFQIGYTYSF